MTAVYRSCSFEIVRRISGYGPQVKTAMSAVHAFAAEAIGDSFVRGEPILLPEGFDFGQTAALYILGNCRNGGFLCFTTKTACHRERRQTVE